MEESNNKTSNIPEEVLEELYSWVDQVQVSRPKKDIKRDFSDGVLVAEVVKFYLPHMVELHNYSPANRVGGKLTNWNLLNKKVFRKLGFELGDDVIRNVAACKPWSLEEILMLLRRKLDCYLYEKKQKTDRSEAPEADQKRSGDLSPRQKSSPNTQASGGSTVSLGKTRSLQNLHKQTTVALAHTSKYHTEMVPRVKVEEKEQEILIKEETIQILQAKVRRLEHLLHLKDIRIDDLQGRMDRLETEMRPTAPKR